MKVTKKEIFAALYFFVSLLAVCGETQEDKSFLFVTMYYLISFTNLGISVYIINRLDKQRNDSITTNRTGISERID